MEVLDDEETSILLGSSIHRLQDLQLDRLEQMSELSEKCVQVVNFLCWYQQHEVYQDPPIFLNRLRTLREKHGIHYDADFIPDYPNDWALPEALNNTEGDPDLEVQIIKDQIDVEERLIQLELIESDLEKLLETGLASEVVENFTVHAVSEGESCDERCPVCLGEYEVGENVFTLDCGHKIHQSCGLEWFKINRTCPICRFNFSNQEENRFAL